MTKTLATLKRIAEKTNISQALLAKRMRVTEATIVGYVHKREKIEKQEVKA